MGIFEDVYDEWKKASPKEKWIIGGVSVGAIALALYLHSKSSSSSVAGTGTTGLPGTFQQGSTGSPGSTGNPPPSPQPSPQPGPPPGPRTAGRWITVGKDVPLGTTLAQIAQQFGLTIDQLGQMNPWAHIGDPNGYNTNLPGNIDNQVVQVSNQVSVDTPTGGSRPRSSQPTRATDVYANTRHAPAAMPHKPGGMHA